MLEPDRVRQIRDELGHRPWHELALEDLARSAGLSRMTLHRRGISREDILSSLAELLEREHQEAALPALTSLAPAPERLRLALLSICDVDERYLGLMEALDIHLAEIYHEPGEGQVLTRGPFVQRDPPDTPGWHRRGSLSSCRGDVDETATLLFNATGWTYRHMRSGHRWPADKARAQVADLLVAGMRA